MRNLVPVDFADLGVLEFVWLLLAFGGLSLVAQGTAWRRRVAIGVAVLTALFGIVRLFAHEGGLTAWDRWLGPVLFAPAFGAGIVLLGALRPWLDLHVPRLSWVWSAALVLLTVVARPFGITHWTEWLFLAGVGFAAAALLGAADVRALLARRVGGPVRGWMLFAPALLALCGEARPFGVGWIGALGILVLLALAHAVVEQGAPMRKFVTRRLIGAPVVLVILLVLSFVIMRTAPGGPFDKEKAVDPEIQEIQRAKYGLDKPLAVQFGRYMRDLAWEGDLGLSTKQKGRTVNEIIAQHAGPSIRLGLAATALALLVGITAGLVSGIRQNSIFDYASMTGAMIGLALPTFVVGPMLVLVFAIKLDWFHVSGFEDFPIDLVLPAITLSLPFAARVARLTRAGMLEIVNQDYIRTARAKGLSEPVIVIRHTLKGTLLPVVSFLGPAVAQLLTGSLVVEMIFNVPGLGTEFVQSALNRDYSLAMGLVVLFGTLLIVFNLVVDIAYGFLDPRIRHG